jgi:two-component sensor histidine kinase
LEENVTTLQRLDEFKELMIGTVAHDLKNPLNTIIGLTDSEYALEHRQTVNEAGKQMLVLVMNLLDIQKFEDTVVKLNTMTYSLYSIVNEAIQQTEYMAQSRMVAVINEVEPLLRVHVDSNLIIRVFVNLLTNAIKYSPAEGTVTMYAEKQKDTIKVAVRDTGKGIPANQIHTIFERFGQVQARSAGVARSTGLGLTFCKMVVEAHSMEIWAESEYGKGATFFFTLPCSKSASTEGLQEKIEIQKGRNSSLEVQKEFSAEQLAKEFSQYLPEHQTAIHFVIDKMRPLRVVELGKVMDILSELEAIPHPLLKSWKLQVEASVYSGNETLFYKLKKALQVVEKI